MSVLDAWDDAVSTADTLPNSFYKFRNQLADLYPLADTTQACYDEINFMRFAQVATATDRKMEKFRRVMP